MMDKPLYVDYETRICASALNAMASTVWDALGQATNPQDARNFIGAVEEAPTDGASYARTNGQWTSIQVGNLHNDLAGRSSPDAHPVSAITGLQSALDQINLDLAGKAPSSASTATGTSFSPTGSIASANVQAALAELDGDVTANAGAITALDGAVVKRTSATGAAIIPAGNTAARPATPGDGYFRFNEQLSIFEGYTTINGWVPIGGGQITASDVSFTPGGTISANNVQLAIGELDTEKAPVGASYTKAESDSLFRPKAYAPGEIIQQVLAADNGVTGFSNPSFVSVTQSVKTITPKSTNSIVLLQVFGQATVNNVTGVNTQVNLQMWNYRSNSGGAVFSCGAPTASGGVGWNGTIHADMALTNNSLDPISCALFGQAVGAGASIGITELRFVLTEIQN